MTPSSVPGLSPVSGLSPVAPAAPSAATTAPYGASLAADGDAFRASLDAARTRVGGPEAPDGSAISRAALEPLDQLDTEAKALGDYAATAVASDNTLAPGEIVHLTVQSQKFMFHSQLTANVANRVAEGMQQLFRQQG